MDTEPTEEEMRRARAISCLHKGCRQTMERQHYPSCDALTHAIAAYAAERVRAAYEAGQRDAVMKGIGYSVPGVPDARAAYEAGQRDMQRRVLNVVQPAPGWTTGMSPYDVTMAWRERIAAIPLRSAPVPGQEGDEKDGDQ